MQKRGLSLLLFVFATTQASQADWIAYPGDIFLPSPNGPPDSVSLRYTQHSSEFKAIGLTRRDIIPGPVDASGHSSWLKTVTPGNATVDSIFQSADWSRTVPSSDPKNRSPAPVRVVEQTFLRSVLQSNDTMWSAWDATTRSLVTTSTDQDSGCSWKDSSALDVQGRLVYQSTCQLSVDEGSTDPYLNFLIYRAWFANSTDSLPARESAWEHAPSGDALDDSLTVVGAPNRPDSLIVGGSSFAEALTRDATGRVVRIEIFFRGTGQGVDSSTYAYDSKGRVISEAYLTFGDTITFLYSWGSGTGVVGHIQAARPAHIVGHGLVLDLAAPSRVGVEVISLDGKRLAQISDRVLPAGRSVLPLSARPGELVRVRSSQGESVLKVPLR